MEWVIESYDRRTDRDAEHSFTTESAFISAAEDLLRNGGRGFVSATLPDGTIVRDERALRALIAASPLAHCRAVVLPPSMTSTAPSS
jgi:hypothetical protein